MAKFKQSQQRRKLKFKGKLRKVKKREATEIQDLNASSLRIPNLYPIDAPCEHKLLSTGWFAFPNIKNALKSLMGTLSSLYWWCHNTAIQSFDLAKGIVFPSHTYLQELMALRQQIEKLESDFLKLQEGLQTKEAVAFGIRKTLSHHKQDMLKNDFQATSAPLELLTPPRPPPPPPPLPPPTLVMQKPLLILKKTASTKICEGAPLKKEGTVQITLKDLLNVKLKKTNAIEKPKMESSRIGRSPLITISDLQGVNLKTRFQLPQKFTAEILTKPTPSKGPHDLRKHLKKVNVERSPGGTPMYDRNKENGTGLTPIMTQALKRKFQIAHPKSPSPSWLLTVNRSSEEG